MEQTYPGPEDNRRHFMALRDAFLDKRYLRVNECPIFVVHRPAALPHASSFIREWQELAVQGGLPGLHFVATLMHKESTWDYKSQGFDSCVVVNSLRVFGASRRERFLGVNAKGEMRQWLWRHYLSTFGQFSNVRLYEYARRYMLDGCGEQPDVYPCVTPNWDNTPRSGMAGYVLHDSTPGLFRQHLRDALTLVQSRPMNQRLVFIKSWNEWAEGNYLEPDQKFGHDYLKVVREEVSA
jgi:hypothetical protein